jgi:hypothetical protein
MPNGPRPFYVVGHNPDTIEGVHAALDAGANAIEPDVNMYAARPEEFCVSESGVLDPSRGGSPAAPPLEQFLTQLHDIALQRPELALVVFDCKPMVATASHGVRLLNLVRTLLTFDTALNVIFSVAHATEIAMFQIIGPMLGPREGGMVDQDNVPLTVCQALEEKAVPSPCFGNGISFLNNILGPHVKPSMVDACELRRQTGRPRFIYVWTVDDTALQREYIQIGVDGIITNHADALLAVTQEPEFQPLIRLATRADNPFLSRLSST